MSTIQSIQFFVAINLLAIGLSHWLQPKMWITFFLYLAEKGNNGNLFNALLSLGTGAFILSFHFVWKWPIILVTIYGLLLLLKGILFLCFPGIGVKSISQVRDKTQQFQIVGVLLCVLSGLLFYHLYQQQVFQL